MESKWSSREASGRRPANGATLALACACSVAAGLSVLAPAAAQTLGPLVRITNDDPFATCTADNVAQQEIELGSTLFPNTSIEPWVAVDPTNPQRLLVGHQQDRWNDGGARGLVGSVSNDGGTTWTETIPGGVTECTGGTFARASDPWVTFSPNGHAFFSSLVVNHGKEQRFEATGGGMQVSRSTDHAVTWEAPIMLITDGANALNDKNSITADPNDINLVYTVWDRLEQGASSGVSVNDGVSIAQSRVPRTPTTGIGPFPSRGPTLLSRTTDGGDSWETPRVIFDPGVGSQTINNQAVVLPNGDVLVFFTSFCPTGGRTSPSSARPIRASPLTRRQPSPPTSRSLGQ
jgi:hypothetical protein